MTPQSKPSARSKPSAPSRPTAAQSRPRPPKGAPRSRAVTRGPRRISAMQLTWIGTGVVIVVVVALVVANGVFGGSSKERTNFPVLPAAEFYDLTHIPTSVYNTVGIDSPTIPVYSQDLLSDKNQPPLTKVVNLKKVPYIFYWGAEFCPYCAASRWGIVAALERFGTFDHLNEMLSASDDNAGPNTPTITFYKSTYISKYFAFDGFEVEDRNGQPLMSSSSVNSIVAKYNPSGYFPFFDVDNKYFIEGTVFDPKELAGATQASIIAGLSDASSPVTQVIITEANLISAEICSTVPGAPKSVCQSRGVKQAMGALKVLQPLNA